MAIRYLKSFKSTLFRAATGGSKVTELIWGDPVHVADDAPAAGRIPARARAQAGFVEATELMDDGLLEIYVIDVGQGDSILFRTPDDRWHIIDAGNRNADQMTRKGAANFVRWKFLRDLERDRAALETVIISHPDADHFTGMENLLAGDLGAHRTDPGRFFPVEVERFFHPGMGRFRDDPPLGARVDGEVAPFPHAARRLRRSGSFITELLDGKGDFANPARPFTDDFSALADLVGRVPNQVARIARSDGFLPGYGPGDNDVTIHVLGPVVEDLTDGHRGLRWLTSESVTRNGHSVVLRLDYGQARILLTGDLNERSQKLLLAYIDEAEFTVDAAKACHHGAEDVLLDFIKAIGARATVISSGDNENFSHPRPVLLGASARYGRESLPPGDDDEEPQAPLLYSTELARSVTLGFANRVEFHLEDDPAVPPRSLAPDRAAIRTSASGLFRPLDEVPVETDLVYGLVNVRTDGVHVLTGTLEESGSDFDVKVFRAGVDAPD